MRLYYHSGAAALFHGDAADLGQVLKENSVDALVCDPPSGTGFMGKDWDKDKGGRDAWIAWLAGILAEALRVLKPGAHGLVWALPRTSHWTMTACEDAGFEVRDRVSHFFGNGFPKTRHLARDIDRAVCTLDGRHYDATLPKGARAKEGDHICPESPEGLRYYDYRTALKPACEDWILVRKPPEGTLAANVLKWGTGGLNVGACRYGESTQTVRHGHSGDHGIYGGDDREFVRDNPGRYPAHVVLDEQAAAVLDEQAGESTSRAGKPRAGKPGDGWGMTSTGREHNDSGGRSRFFYCAKPSRAERDAGCEDLRPTTGGQATGRQEGSAGLSNPRAGAGRTGGSRNFHPTVKAQGLMEWLCDLVTPPGGLVLDPFTGSGSTGIAAVNRGFEFVGVEHSEEYAEIARARIDHAIRSMNAETD